MSHFNLKSLSFYAVAIGSVVLLFKGVTVYGESRIKAPPSIAGRYQIPLKSLAGCGSDQAILMIHQSGIYLNASLQGENRLQESARIEEKPELGGKLQGQNFVLSGLVEGAKLCRLQKENKWYKVTILAEMKEDRLKGKIMLLGLNKPLEFTAKREKPEQDNAQTH